MPALIVHRAPKVFADIISADFKIFLNEESESKLQHRYAAMVKDCFRTWTQSYPTKTKER